MKVWFLQFLQWLLGLDNIRLGQDAPLFLRWEKSIPSWILFCLSLIIVGWIVFSYRREQTRIVRRVLLGTIRCAVLALGVIALSRPVLVFQHNRIEPSQVALLVDSSLSMNNRDRSSEVEAGVRLRAEHEANPISRLGQVKKALLASDEIALRKLVEKNGVQLSSFSSGVEPLAFAENSDGVGDLNKAIESMNADSPSTDVVGAIRQVLERSQGRHLAAIVLATDGQSTQSGSMNDAIDAAVGRQIPIYALRVGSTKRPTDIEVGPLRAPDRVFVHDLLAVEAPVSVRSTEPSVAVKLTLIDERNGAVVATQTTTIETQGPPKMIELRTKTSRPGQARFRVVAEALPDELNKENNTDRVDVNILDDRLRVLYVEGYPRFEYRYLKNALLREQTVQLSVLLLEVDEDFVQEGTDPIRRFPETPEELNRFDVVLFGDVDPRSGWLSASQMNMLLDYVGNEGGGFGMIAGERWTPRRFVGTPLEKLIPVNIDTQFLGRYDAPLTIGFRPTITSEGRSSRILRFAQDRGESERIFDTLPELYWLAKTLGPKPGAAVLLEHPGLNTPNGSMPVVVLGRYGAGKVFFQATDDTWRWRRSTGEFLHDSYWVQVARELMRDSRVAQDRRYAITTDRRTYEYASPVRAQVEINDSQLLAERSDAVVLMATRQGDENPGPSTPKEPTPTIDSNPRSNRGTEPPIRFEAQRLSAESKVFEVTFVPNAPGGFVITAPDLTPRPGEKPSSAWFRVQNPDLEWRHPEADHETLEKLTAATSGSIIELDSVEEGFAGIRDRRVQIPDDVVEPLWDSKLMVFLFVALLTTEWTFRKVFGLL
ncbi:MAG: VWA domain-containing protein [Planctomycetes bacterium]|nr:VWA domain-containing protein [Planctomycetota bacterium]MBI3836251.1 VWA domain-containing protein [Planctomycetota bacterium]